MRTETRPSLSDGRNGASRKSVGGRCTSSVSARRGGLGLQTRQYRAVAQKKGSCVVTQITDTMPLQPNNVQIKPILVVEPSGVMACR